MLSGRCFRVKPKSERFVFWNFKKNFAAATLIFEPPQVVAPCGLALSVTTHCMLAHTDMDVNHNYYSWYVEDCSRKAVILHLHFSPFSSQPLMDNLESQTYEVFEKDPIKYSQYQQVRL